MHVYIWLTTYIYIYIYIYIHTYIHTYGTFPVKYESSQRIADFCFNVEINHLWKTRVLAKHMIIFVVMFPFYYFNIEL